MENGSRVMNAVTKAIQSFGRDFTAAELLAALRSEFQSVAIINALHRLMETEQVERITVGCGQWRYRSALTAPRKTFPVKGVVRSNGRIKHI